MKTTDFLQHDFKDQRYDLVIMNPPFKRTVGTQMIKKAATISDNVAFITALNTSMDNQSAHIKDCTIVSINAAKTIWDIGQLLVYGIYSDKYSQGNSVLYTRLKDQYHITKAFEGLTSINVEAGHGISAIGPNTLSINCTGALLYLAGHTEATKYIDTDETIETLVKAGYKRISGIKIPVSRIDELKKAVLSLKGILPAPTYTAGATTNILNVLARSA